MMGEPQDWDNEIARVVDRTRRNFAKYERGALTPAEFSDMLIPWWSTEVVPFHRGGPEQTRRAASAFIGELLVGMVEYGDREYPPLTGGKLVEVACFAYGPRPPITAAAAHGQRWRQLDEDYPDIRGIAMEDFRENGLRSECLGALPDCPEVRGAFAQLRATQLSLDDEFDLLVASMSVVPDTVDTADFVDLMHRARAANNRSVEQGCLSVVEP